MQAVRYYDDNPTYFVDSNEVSLMYDIYIATRGLNASQLGRLGAQFWVTQNSNSGVTCPAGTLLARYNEFYQWNGTDYYVAGLCQYINQ